MPNKDWFDPGEEREARRKRLADAREQLRQHRLSEQEKAAYEAAAREHVQHLKGDMDWERKVQEILGDDLDIIADALRHSADTPEEVAAQDAWREAQKAMRGGLIFGPNRGKAERILRRNRGVIKKTVARRKGCWLFTMMLVGAVGLVVKAVRR